jgi:hypothetical protein
VPVLIHLTRWYIIFFLLEKVAHGKNENDEKRVSCHVPYFV